MAKLATSTKAMRPIAEARLSHHTQHGAGMIEVLIAIIIASLALLGLAGLQVNALRFQKTAHYRNLAMQHAMDVADRVRANMQGARSGRYHLQPTLWADGAGVAPGLCEASACTSTQVAQRDVFVWRTNMARTMSGGWGIVQYKDLANFDGGFTVTVYFRDPDKKDGVADPRCVAGTQPDADVRCFQIDFLP